MWIDAAAAEGVTEGSIRVPEQPEDPKGFRAVQRHSEFGLFTPEHDKKHVR